MSIKCQQYGQVIGKSLQSSFQGFKWLYGSWICFGYETSKSLQILRLQMQQKDAGLCFYNLTELLSPNSISCLWLSDRNFRIKLHLLDIVPTLYIWLQQHLQEGEDRLGRGGNWSYCPIFPSHILSLTLTLFWYLIE